MGYRIVPAYPASYAGPLLPSRTRIYLTDLNTCSVPVQLAKFDPPNFKEPVGDFPGSEVHRVLFCHWKKNENDCGRSGKARIADRNRRTSVFPTMPGQDPQRPCDSRLGN